MIPDLCHDMHNCSVASGNRWLAEFAPTLFRSERLQDSVVFVTFDESRGPNDRSGGGGRVAAIVAGPLVRTDSLSAVALSHYSLLRTIEDNWHLPRLGRSASVRAITGIWRLSR